MIQSIRKENGDSFSQINKILDFTAKAEIAINEQYVQENIDYFGELLSLLNEDLSKLAANPEISLVPQDLTNLLSSLQFTYAMNFDDRDLWLKLTTLLNLGLD